MPTNGRPDFQQLLSRFADFLGWNPADINEHQAHFLLHGEEGEELELLVFLTGGRADFLIPSGMAFESEDEVLGDVSTELLQRNAGLVYGAWTLVELDEAYSYAIYWPVALEDLAEMPLEIFARRVKGLLKECADFDATWNLFSWDEP